jgi:hypothetical protein
VIRFGRVCFGITSAPSIQIRSKPVVALVLHFAWSVTLCHVPLLKLPRK